MSTLKSPGRILKGCSGQPKPAMISNKIKTAKSYIRLKTGAGHCIFFKNKADFVL